MVQNIEVIRSKFFVIALIVFVVSLFGIPSLAAAEQQNEDVPKTIRLDLNDISDSDGNAQGEENREFDLEEAKELLQQVNMTDDAAEVVENVTHAASELLDLCADVEVTQVKADRVDTITGHLMASTQHKVARLEFHSPSALRGQIIVVDQATMQARVYMPVTDQITVQNIEDMGEEAVAALSITDVSGLFDFSKYAVELDDVHLVDETVHYVLKITGFEGQVQYVKVDGDSWIPYEFAIYEEDVLIGTLVFRNVFLDQDLAAETILSLPDVKELRL